MRYADTWIILILVLALFALAFFSYANIMNGAARISANFPAVAAAIERESWQEARELFGRSRERWEQVSKIWPMLINHDDMRDVEISFVDMEVLLEQENRERAARELANMRYYLEHVPDNERFSWQNIL